MLRSLKSVFSLSVLAMFAAAFAAAAAPTTGTYGRLPLLFERNEGQVDPAVRFLSRGRGYSLYLTASEAALRLTGEAEAGTATVRWQVVGADPEARISGERAQATKSNYFIGADRSKWRTGVANYGQVRYAGVYPGIDLVYHGSQRQVEYDFVVAPKGDPKRIRLHFDGIESLHVGRDGELVLRTTQGDIVQPRPIVYQERNGKRQLVKGSYALLGNNEIGFKLGRYDRSRELVIDPVIVYSTFFGGTFYEEGDALAADSDGNAYMAGPTLSPSFPGSASIVLQPQTAGDYDVFIAKINPQGTAVVWATYLGGSGAGDYCEGIAVDSSGNVIVSGDTNSTDFPLSNAVQSTYGGSIRDSWVTKINAAGTAIVYSTYLGGTADEGNLDVAVDGSGNAYVVGHTASSAFAGVTGGSLQPANAGSSDGYLVKLTSAGAVGYATFLGGTAADNVSDVVLDASGNAYLSGRTSSTNFPGVTGSSLQPANAGSWDAFIAKINAAGSAILWATYLGGSSEDRSSSIDRDSSGNLVVAGSTYSTTFPGVTGSSIQSTLAGTRDAFVTKLNSDASAILWSTYLGGSNDETVPLSGIGLDASGNVYVGGFTLSTTFPGVTGSSFQPAHGGAYDGFLAKINAAGSAIVWATFLGGSGWDMVWALDVDAAGNVYASGYAESSSLPGVTSDAIQPTNLGGNEDGPGDAFLIKITDSGPSLTSISPTSGYPGTQVTLTGTNFGALQGSGSVWLGSKLAGSIVSWTNTQIVAVVASGATSGNAIVQQNGIWSNSIAFTVIAPNITSITPTSGFPGTQVTFTGTNFGATQGSGSVWLGNKAAGSIVSWSDTQVVATVAANAASGNAQIQQNGVWSNAIAFTVPTPSITSITPTSGAVGTQVTFTGTNFGTTQGSGSVWLGSKLAGSIVSWSNTQIVATVASGSVTGSAQVQQGGVWSNSIAFTVTTPSLSSVSPTTARAGDQITLTGTNFGASGTASQVWLGNKAAGSIVSWSSTQIVATVASGAKSGSAQVQQGGVWSNSIAFTVITPNVTSISPTSGPVGTQVTITGTGFGTTQGSGQVWIGTKYATVVSWSDTQVVATVASGSATGGTQVYQNGVWSNAVTFTVTP